MSHIPSSIIEDILDRVDIVDVVGEYVTLRKVGANYAGLCPFHTEKTPSFNVNPPRKIFHCFGCQVGGDAIKFLQEIEGLSFVEAVKKLALKVGVEIPEDDPKGRTTFPREHAQALKDLNRLALSFYIETLHGPEGEKAREYLLQRGVGKDAWERHQIGYAPPSWDGLLHYLSRRKAPIPLAVELGLLVEKGESRYYDRFRGRIMFPVLSPGGEVLGFSGRTLDAEAKEAKYLNSPESVIFKKGDGFLGLYFAKRAIRKSGMAVLVEGNFDYLSLHEKGVTEAVAPMGTALSAAQVRTLRRFAAERVVLLYDGDAAGERAQKRAIPLLLAEGLFPRVAVLPAGEDPDSFARKNPPEVLRRFLSSSEDALERWMEEASQKTKGDIPARAKAVEEISQVISQIKDKISQELYRKKLAERLWVSKELLSRQAPPNRPAPVVEKQPQERFPETEFSLVKLLLVNSRLRLVARELEASHDISHPELKAIIELLQNAPPEEPEEKILASIENDGIKQALRGVLIRPEEYEASGQEAEQRVIKTVKRIREQKLERLEAEYKAAVAAAKAEGDEEKAAQLLAHQLRLKREKEQLRRM